MMKTNDLYDVAHGLESAVVRMRRGRIDLSDSEMVKGRRIQAEVTSAVEELSGRDGFPVLLDDEPFGAGSFGRRTQAQPLDDIDIFFPLDAGDLRMESPEGKPTAESLISRSPNTSLGCEEPLYEGRWLHSGRVLDRIVPLLCEQLVLRPRQSDCGKNRRGRCAHFSYEGVNVDLVFVLWAEHASMDRYLLPAGSFWSWKASNPKDDQRRLTRENQDQHNGLLLPAIRLLKAWNDHPCGGRLKSIHLEILLTERIFADVEIDGTVSALAFALDRLPEALDQTCPDPTGLGDDLDVNLDLENRRWVQEHARSCGNQLRQVLDEAGDDLGRAAAAIELMLLSNGDEPPSRDRADRQPRHDDELGQPAHRCNHPGEKDFYVPPFRTEDRAPYRADQTKRSGQYG